MATSSSATLSAINTRSTTAAANIVTANPASDTKDKKDSKELGELTGVQIINFLKKHIPLYLYEQYQCDNSQTAENRQKRKGLLCALDVMREYPGKLELINTLHKLHFGKSTKELIPIILKVFPKMRKKAYSQMRTGNATTELTQIMSQFFPNWKEEADSESAKLTDENLTTVEVYTRLENHIGIPADQTNTAANSIATTAASTTITSSAASVASGNNTAAAKTTVATTSIIAPASVAIVSANNNSSTNASQAVTLEALTREFSNAHSFGSSRLSHIQASEPGIYFQHRSTGIQKTSVANDIVANANASANAATVNPSTVTVSALASTASKTPETAVIPARK